MNTKNLKTNNWFAKCLKNYYQNSKKNLLGVFLQDNTPVKKLSRKIVNILENALLVTTAVTKGQFNARSTDQEFRNLSFDLANFFHGKCCSSKTISARSSAEVSKLYQRDVLQFI